MNSPRLLVALPAILLAGLGLYGCGSSGGGSAFHNIPVSDATREAAFASIDAKQQTLVGQTAAATNTALAAFMATRPEFEATGVPTDGCAWGRFTDGRLVILANNRPVEPGKAQLLPRSPQRRAAAGLPQSTSISIFDTMGPVFSHPQQGIQDLLTSRGYNSAQVSVGPGTVAQLKAMQPPGIFYMTAHGGSGYVRGSGTGKITDHVQMYSIWTSTPVRLPDGHLDTAQDLLLRSDLDSNRLVYMQAKTDVYGPFNAPVYEWRYAITPSFVTTYMKFAANSIVLMNACSSDNADLKAAMFQSGAGLYMGWTQPAFDAAATNAALFLFDRFLGNNLVQPTPGAGDPPLDWAAIHTAMATTLVANGPDHYGHSAAVPGYTESDLTFTAGQGDAAVIVPSISSVSPDWSTHQLTLTGEFGAKTGTAAENSTTTTAGTPLTVVSWSGTQVVLQLPDDCKTAQLLVDGRTGNIVPVPTGRSKIDPVSSTVGPGGTVYFTASTDATIPTGSFVTYHWSTSGTAGLLSDTRGHSGVAFDSTDNQALYTPNHSAAVGQDTVTVAINIVTGKQKTNLGPATANVTLVKSAPIPIGKEVHLASYTGFPDKWYEVAGFYTFKEQPSATEYDLKGNVNVSNTFSFALLESVVKDGTANVVKDDLSFPDFGNFAPFVGCGYPNTLFVNMGNGVIGLGAFAEIVKESDLGKGQADAAAFFSSHTMTGTYK